MTTQAAKVMVTSSDWFLTKVMTEYNNNDNWNSEVAKPTMSQILYYSQATASYLWAARIDH